MSSMMEVKILISAADVNAQYITSACQQAISYSIQPYMPPWTPDMTDITQGWVKIKKLSEIDRKMKGHEIHNQGLYAIAWDNEGITPFHAGCVYIGQTERDVHERIMVFEAAFRGVSNNHHGRISKDKTTFEEGNGEITKDQLACWYRLHSIDGYARQSRKNSMTIEKMALHAHYFMNEEKYPMWNKQSLSNEECRDQVRCRLIELGWI